MIPVIDNPEILALYEALRPAPPQSNSPEPEPQYARAPEGNGHEAALKDKR